jgi:hypothetical protein
MKKDTPWQWADEQQLAFSKLKEIMCKEPVLRQPDYNKQFILQTDTSAYGMGAVLSQQGETSPTHGSR